MAYRKRGYRKRYQKKQEGRWSIYGKATRQLAQDAIKGVKFVKGLINTEFKNIDNNNYTTPLAGGSLILLNGTTQGDGQSNREGSSFRMKSIDVRWSSTYNATAGYNTYRVMCVLDKQANGATPSVTDVLESNTIDSPRNLDYRKRFKILFDKVYCIGSAGPQQDYGHFHIKNEIHTQCYEASNLGTVADISSNSLFLLVLSDQGTNGPVMNYYSRIRFLDN